jgi:hypothetical protein
MSELSTGAVPLVLIGAPLAIGAACIGAIYFAGKYLVDEFEKRLKEIDQNNERLKWLDKQVISSPAQMAEEAKRLQKMVSADNKFLQMTMNLNVAQKNILAGCIATQNSPLKAYVPSLLQNMPESVNAFETALAKGTLKLAMDNFKFVNSIVGDAARNTGFTKQVKILKQTGSLLDIVFTDDQNRRLSAYCKLDKQLNPSLALDLEGFDTHSGQCTTKMNEIVKYLQEHGVPFNYKRIRHNQPSGVLRSIVAQRTIEDEQKKMGGYLQGKVDDVIITNKKIKQ